MVCIGAFVAEGVWREWDEGVGVSGEVLEVRGWKLGAALSYGGSVIMINPSAVNIASNRLMATVRSGGDARLATNSPLTTHHSRESSPQRLISSTTLVPHRHPSQRFR